MKEIHQIVITHSQIMWNLCSHWCLCPKAACLSWMWNWRIWFFDIWWRQAYLHSFQNARSSWSRAKLAKGMNKQHVTCGFTILSLPSLLLVQFVPFLPMEVHQQQQSSTKKPDLLWTRWLGSSEELFFLFKKNKKNSRPLTSFQYFPIQAQMMPHFSSRGAQMV